LKKLAFNVTGGHGGARQNTFLLISLIMVATRSTRASARLKRNEAEESVEENMEDNVEKTEADTNEVENKCDVPQEECRECNNIKNEPTKDNINEIIASTDKEDEEKPDRVTGYLKGFAKRVILCTILVMAAKNFWPHIQSRFWPEEPVKEGKLYILNDKSFRGHVSRGDHFVMMFAPWCGHCLKLKPDWEKLAKKPGVNGVSISKLDCTASTNTCSEHEVQGYPTLLYFRDGKKIATYDGAKTLEGLKAYLKKMRKGEAKSSPKKAESKPVKAKKKKTKQKAEL